MRALSLIHILNKEAVLPAQNNGTNHEAAVLGALDAVEELENKENTFVILFTDGTTTAGYSHADGSADLGLLDSHSSVSYTHLAAEDRELFDQILEECEIPRQKGHTVYTAEEAKKAANELGYPVLVRPSYVLGGQGMQIAINDQDVEEFIGIINRIAQEHPILVDKYLMGKEIEVDAVCDGEEILIPGIMEHIERAGIHSGDSISVYPAQTISETAKKTIEEYTRRLAKSLHVIGMINIQFIVCGEEVYVIEVNPRSSRTVPYISKVTGIPIVPLATKVILGYKLRDLGYEPGLQPEAEYLSLIHI